MFREFFYFQKSDRQVIVALLCVIAIALVLIFLTGKDFSEADEPRLVASDSVSVGNSPDAAAQTARNHGDRFLILS